MIKLRWLAAAAAAMSVAGAAAADLLWHEPGQDSYRSETDSPWSTLSTEWDYFYLENFEDGALNTLGAYSMGDGAVRFPNGATDSVDGDDGVMDGWGKNGHSWFQAGPTGPIFEFGFDEEALGILPTRAGIVWTDGNALAEVTFEAFDRFGDSVGSFTTTLGDGVHNGSTEADRFLGVEFDGGISSIMVSSSFGGLEVDHLQYGELPGPATLAALAVFGLLAGRRRTA